MPERQYDLGASSKENGIIFRSNYIPAVYNVTEQEDGSISTEMLPKKHTIFRFDDKSESKKKYYLVFILISIILAIATALIFKDFSLFTAISFFIINAYDDLFSFLWVVYIMNSSPRGKSLARYHAAEHMVIRAYEKYRRIPTIEEVNNTSRFSRSCGSLYQINRIIFVFCFSIIVYLSNTFLTLMHFFILLGLTSLFLIFARNFSLFRFFEFFVTKKPTEKELNLAIAGIKFFDEMETILENSPNIVNLFNQKSEETSRKK